MGHEALAAPLGSTFRIPGPSVASGRTSRVMKALPRIVRVSAVRPFPAARLATSRGATRARGATRENDALGAFVEARQPTPLVRTLIDAMARDASNG